jgi:festuclavine dehydrogenase
VSVNSLSIFTTNANRSVENLSEQQHLPTIRDEGTIYTATGKGKVPFCSADDIAAMAFHALASAEAPNREFFILGPELLTYDDVAETLSKVLGKRIQHVNLTAEGFAQRLLEYGVPESSARALSQMDIAISQGAEERSSDDVYAVLGRQPKSLQLFAEENRSKWA